MPRLCRRPRTPALLVIAASILGAALGVRVVGAAESSGPSLLVVWPPDQARVDGERVRVGGRTDPDAQVAVNGKPLKVFPSGAFAGTCPLKVGANEIVFRAAKDGRTKTASRTIRRPTPLSTLPSLPARFDPNYDGQPSEDVVVRPGDWVHIRVKGSPGHKAAFRIGSRPTRYPLFPTTRYGANGFYEGAYQIRSGDAYEQARVTCYLAAAKGKSGDAAEMKIPGTITVDTRPFADAARASEDYVRLRAEPRGGAPLLAARQGTLFCIDGRVGDALRVALAPGLHAWISRDSVVMAENEPALRRGSVTDLAVVESETATVVRIPVETRVPFVIKANTEGSAIELTLFGVENRLNWITDRTARGGVEIVAAMPPYDGCCKFEIAVRDGPMLGYRAHYEDTVLCVTVRHALKPSGDAARPLAWRTILLDPGHGGESLGTIGSTGLPEKTVDLEMARTLRRLLEERGARVRMTRSGDVDVSLAERARQAEQDGDLFVSIHNNSIALTGDPLAARGLGVYYYHPHARPVAQAIYRRMQGVEPQPEPDGLVTADLYVVREVTAMPSVLLECLFLSHPEDEMLLLDKDYVQRDMEAVAQGIVEWFSAASEAGSR